MAKYNVIEHEEDFGYAHRLPKRYTYKKAVRVANKLEREARRDFEADQQLNDEDIWHSYHRTMDIDPVPRTYFVAKAIENAVMAR